MQPEVAEAFAQFLTSLDPTDGLKNQMSDDDNLAVTWLARLYFPMTAAGVSPVMAEAAARKFMLVHFNWDKPDIKLWG